MKVTAYLILYGCALGILGVLVALVALFLGRGGPGLFRMVYVLAGGAGFASVCMLIFAALVGGLHSPFAVMKRLMGSIPDWLFFCFLLLTSLLLLAEFSIFLARIAGGDGVSVEHHVATASGMLYAAAFCVIYAACHPRPTAAGEGRDAR